jgi:hypothetical protein
MFAPDIISLRQFYATPFGEAVRTLLAQTIQKFWPQVSGDTVLCIGHATPYMQRYIDQAKPLMMCMPAAQGAAYWPPTRANLVFLADESELPLQENSVNRVLLIHSLENSERLSWMMEEIWRVLTPEGRVLAIVPNRLSLWSRSARSPFAYGRPFSMAQLRGLMGDHRFAPTRACSALFIPPTRNQLCWKIAGRLERICQWLGLHIGGVLIIEAEKQVYAAILQPALAHKKAYRANVAAPKPIMGRQSRQL